MVLSSSTGDLRGGLTVSYANACCDESASRARRSRGIARVGGPWVLAACGCAGTLAQAQSAAPAADRKSTRLNSSHSQISYAVFCLKKKKMNDKALSTLADTLSTY